MGEANDGVVDYEDDYDDDYYDAGCGDPYCDLCGVLCSESEAGEEV